MDVTDTTQVLWSAPDGARIVDIVLFCDSDGTGDKPPRTVPMSVWRRNAGRTANTRSTSALRARFARVEFRGQQKGRWSTEY
jgi:hypothetical protein